MVRAHPVGGRTTIVLEYRRGGRRGVHSFDVPGAAPTALLVDEVARQIRNTCVLVGPESVRVTSPRNVLAEHAEAIGTSDRMVAPQGWPIVDVLSAWHGNRVAVDFVGGEVGSVGPVLLGPPRPAPALSLPALVVNIGQSALKIGVVSPGTGGGGMRVVPRAGAARPEDIVADVREAVLDSVSTELLGSLRVRTVAFAVGSIVGRRDVSPVPNGVTRHCRGDQVVRLRDGLVDLVRELHLRGAETVFVNDGLLVAMAHRDESRPGATLVLRCGTSLCGGIDDEDVLGEVGWIELGTRGGRTSARDLLSAGSVAALPPGRRAEHVASATREIVAVASHYHDLSGVVLCGSLLTSVPRDALRHAWEAEKAGLPAHVSSRIAMGLSDSGDQQALATRGIVRMSGTGLADGG